MRKHITRVISNTFIKGGVLIFIGSIAVSLLNYLFNSLAGKLLGPAGYGEIATFFSYITIFTVPGTIVTALIVRRLGQAGPERFAFAHTLEQWFLSKLRAWSFLGILPILAIPFLPALTRLSPPTAVGLALAIPFLPLTALYNAMTQGLQLFGLVAAISATSALVKLLGILVAYTTVPSLWIVISFMLLSYATAWSLSLIMLHRRRVTLPKQAEIVISKRIRDILLAPSLLMAMAALMSITILGNIDIIVAKKVLSGHEAGIYSAWSLFAKMILYAGSPITTVSYIFFSDIQKKRWHRFALIFVTVLIAFGGACAFYLYSFYGNFLIHFFLSRSFDAIVPLLPSAALFGTGYLLVTIYTQYLVARSSKLALIPPFSLPLYLLAIIIGGINFTNLVRVNCIYTLMLAGVLIVSKILWRKT